MIGVKGDMVSLENRTYLNDKDFLFELSKQKNRAVYAKVIALTKDEYPLEELQGKVNGGSINVDGTSSMRRICSVQMILDKPKITEYLWTLKTKFMLEIGLKNTIDNRYPEIIWLPEGLYVITGFNSTVQPDSASISISGKDKMCLLNGEMGGSIADLSVNFSSIDAYNSATNMMETQKLTIRQMLTYLLMDYAHEKPENIIINDLDDYGLELLKYIGDDELFLYSPGVDSESEFSSNYTGIAYKNTPLPGLPSNTAGFTFNDLKIWDNTEQTKKDIGEVHKYPKEQTSLNDIETYYSWKPTKGKYYQIRSFTYGDCIGYRVTDLVYTSDLIIELGGAITSILEKIKNMLVNFEYFYNEYGQFVFQKKRSIKNSVWVGKSIILNQEPESEYTVTNTDLITALQRTPTLTNLKNDFSIWGKRKTTSGVEIPLHIRYAIDHKPEQYTTIDVSDSEINSITSDTTSRKRLKERRNKIYKTTNYDWREILYQMAADYYYYSKAELIDNFLERVAKANEDVYLYGHTNYEQYYLDIFNYWRDIYDPNNIEQDLSFYNKNDYKTNIWATGYSQIDENIFNDKKTAAIKDPENIYNILSTIKIFSSDGIQEYFDTLSVFDTSNKFYYIEYNGNKYMIKNLEDITLKEFTTDFENKINEFFGVKDLAYYSKDKTKINSNSTWSIKNVYYKMGTNYYNLLDKVCTLSDNYKLLTKDSKGYIDKNSATLLDRKYEIKKAKEEWANGKYWWEDKQFPNKTLFQESLKDEKISENPVMQTIYVYKKGTKLRQAFYQYNYDLNGKIISSTLVKETPAYYIGENIYKNSWNQNIFKDPTSLVFWIDFLDSDSATEMEKYSVPVVGQRPYPLNASEYSNSIFQSTVPQVIFTRKSKAARTEEEEIFTGYNFIHTNIATNDLFDISSRKKTLQETLDENLFKYSYCTETISLSILPLYYLQPNTKISIYDEDSGIDGVYEIQKFSIPLTYNAVSSVTAVKYVKQLY